MLLHRQTTNEEEGLLLRAADYRAKLGDLNYLKKVNALFYEFEEVGMNKTLGYETPADVVWQYPAVCWKTSPADRYGNTLSQRHPRRHG